MRFESRWEEIEDGVWLTNDNDKHGNGALIQQIKKNSFVVLVFSMLKDDVAYLQTMRKHATDLAKAKGLAEEFLDRLEGSGL